MLRLHLFDLLWMLYNKSATNRLDGVRVIYVSRTVDSWLTLRWIRREGINDGTAAAAAQLC